VARIGYYACKHVHLNETRLRQKKAIIVGSSVPSFSDWINQLQKFVHVAVSLGSNEGTCVILYGEVSVIL
jgi:hypothetical protein